MAEFDANNNSALPLPEKVQEKYSLRPRASLKREEPDDEHEDSWKPSTRGRSTKRRQKPKPLSRYVRGFFYINMHADFTRVNVCMYKVTSVLFICFLFFDVCSNIFRTRFGNTPPRPFFYFGTLTVHNHSVSAYVND